MSEFKHKMFTNADGEPTPDIIDYDYICCQFKERFREISPFFDRFSTNHKDTEKYYQDRYVIMEIQDLLLYLKDNLINISSTRKTIDDCLRILEMKEEKLSNLIKYIENSDSDQNTSDDDNNISYKKDTEPDNTDSKMVFVKDDDYQ